MLRRFGSALPSARARYPLIHTLHKERRKKEAKKGERKGLLLRLLSVLHCA